MQPRWSVQNYHRNVDDDLAYDFADHGHVYMGTKQYPLGQLCADPVYVLERLLFSLPQHTRKLEE